jgi:hypothetical protein
MNSPPFAPEGGLLQPGLSDRGTDRHRLSLMRSGFSSTDR